VHICTPNTTHADFAARAIKAGKHVVCEKPLATSAAEAEELAQAARRHGVIGAVPFVYRYHPMVREARARIAAGDLGRLLTLNCSYLQDWLLEVSDTDWRVDESLGGPSRAFADIGSHLCDLIEFVTGERIARLTARTRTVHSTRNSRPVNTEDVAALLIETTSGAIGTALISQVAPGRKNALVLELSGASESMRFEQEQPEHLWVGRRDESRIVVRDPSTASPASARLSRVPAGHPMGYQDAFNAFMADVYGAIRGEKPDGLPTFDDGARAARLTEAVLRSAESGDWVEVA
jgi:predicted dehydrogenase